jgi:hypothetical protein
MRCIECFCELRKPPPAAITEAELDAYSPLPSGRRLFAERDLKDCPAWYLVWWLSQRKHRKWHPATANAVARQLGRLFTEHRGFPTIGIHNLEAIEFLI